MNNITITNKEGLIVVKLYIKDDGNIHEDSWICLNGWGNKSFPINKQKKIGELERMREAAEIIDFDLIKCFLKKEYVSPLTLNIERINELQQVLQDLKTEKK